MKRHVNRDQVCTALFFLLGLLICIHSSTYKLGSLSAPGSGFMPFLTGCVMCFLALIGFVHATIEGQNGKQWHSMFTGLSWRRTLLTLAALIGFQLLMRPVGFTLTTVLFIGFLLRAIFPQRWPVVVIVPLLAALFSYLVFEVWLQAQLPKGPWGF